MRNGNPDTRQALPALFRSPKAKREREENTLGSLRNGREGRGLLAESRKMALQYAGTGGRGILYGWLSSRNNRLGSLRLEGRGFGKSPVGGGVCCAYDAFGSHSLCASGLPAA